MENLKLETDESLLSRCRACAGWQESPEKMISLFEKNLSEMYTNCTSVEIAPNDILPSLLCIECFEKLSNFNQFRQNCINSDSFLREQTTTESFKVEPLDEIGIKYEEHEPNLHSESEYHETEHFDEDSLQYDPESIDTNPLKTTANLYLNPFDFSNCICDLCGQKFDRKGKIACHMVKHKNEMKRPKSFVCTIDGCTKVFEKKKSFNSHKLQVHKIRTVRPVKVSTVEKQLKLCCPHCPKQFVIQIKLDGHIRSEHEGLAAYKCPHCEKEFNGSRRYVHHLRFRHSTVELKKYPCTYDGCDRKYGLQNSLREHIARFHLGKKPLRNTPNLICETCGREFKTAYNLKKHSFKHSGLTPFPCEICPKKFTTSQTLKNHTMRHLKIRPFVCPTCGARKTTNKELQSHLNFHSKEITYPCKECPRVFTSYGAVNRHVRIHHRNHKPYICPHCDRAFAKAEVMKNHVMTHTGEKPFACSECGHRFIQSVALRTHMKTHAKKLR